ncbi:hypothetical protein CDAR_58641 [Caerostris darwini]|uniref:Uncharacterized protein n=1 Tax=Caerostris darwini TaxID=1538125 RepID=A0AAV4S1Z2_9ARAC|nr:hypothetical protein CDAR_58641 [Caerostris darwini]
MASNEEGSYTSYTSASEWIVHSPTTPRAHRPHPRVAQPTTVKLFSVGSLHLPEKEDHLGGGELLRFGEPLFGPVWQPRYFDGCPESFATSLIGVKIPARANVPRREATVRVSGESYLGRYSPSLTSSRGLSPASPTPSVSAGRTHRSGRFFPYLKPATSVAACRPPAAAAATPPPPPVAATPPPTTGPVTRSQTGSLPRTSAKRPLAEPTTTASKRLQKAWQLSDAEARDLSEWQKAAHHRFEVLQSVAAMDPGRISSRKRRSIEERNRANLPLDKLMDTSDLLISPTAFARLGRGVLAEVAPQKKYHFAGAALKVLQRAAEDMCISSLVVMYDLTKHRKGIELKKEDFKTFHQIYKGSYPYF